ESENELLVQFRAKRRPRGDAFELADDLAVPAALELRLGAILDTPEPHLLEPGRLDRGERLLELRECRPAPEVERRVRGRGCRIGVAPELLATERGQAGELRDVELGLLRAQGVAAPARDDRIMPERLPELRDVDLHHLGRGLGHELAPEV